MNTMRDFLFWLTIGFIGMMALSVVATVHAEESWFIEPTGSIVWPSNSAITYHSMSGTVFYRSGYSVGLDAGRYFGPFKLYASYTYTSFNAKSVTLQTPYGPISQSDSDLDHYHSVLLNADYVWPIVGGWKVLVGGGAGYGFDSTSSPVIEAHGGVGKDFKWASVYLLCTYRKTYGAITEGHISVERPDEWKPTLILEKRF